MIGEKLRHAIRRRFYFWRQYPKWRMEIRDYDLIKTFIFRKLKIQKDVVIHFTKLYMKIKIRPCRSDIDVLFQILVDDKLNIRKLEIDYRGLIIDGGANIGASTALLAARNPDAIVVAIEPAKDNLRLLRENTASYPNVIVVEGGIWSKTGRLRIANSEAAYWSYRCEEASADDPDSFAAYSIDDIFTIAGRDTCDLLKLDIEGAEVNVFENPGLWLDKTRIIIVEIHNDRARDLLDRIYESGSWKRERHGEKDFLIRCA